MAIKGQSTTLDQTPRVLFPDGGTGPAGGGASPPVGGAGGVALSAGFVDGTWVAGKGPGADGASASGRLLRLSDEGVAVGAEPPPPPQAAKPAIRNRARSCPERKCGIN
jgi:hypothetical protein